MDGSGGGGVAKRDEYEKALHFFNWTPPPFPSPFLPSPPPHISFPASEAGPPLRVSNWILILINREKRGV